MAPSRCLQAVLVVLFVLALCSQGVPVPSPDAHLLLCQPQLICGHQVYDPQLHCCYDQSLVPLDQTRGCGNCTFKVCSEECCYRLPSDGPTFVVRAKGQGCSWAPRAGDRVCHSVS